MEFFANETFSLWKFLDSIKELYLPIWNVIPWNDVTVSKDLIQVEYSNKIYLFPCRVVSSKGFILFRWLDGSVARGIKNCFLRNIHSHKKNPRILEENSSFESILEKTPQSSLIYKELHLGAYFVKQKIFCLGLDVELLDMTSLVSDNAMIASNIYQME